ncbi:MAG: Rrf2 family transcriptional regulator [Bacteriovoracia bacterium]
MNRTSEYGLMALKHIRQRSLHDPQGVTSAREIADAYRIPFEITAKTLQRLKEQGFINSAHGARGGYTLHRNLEQVSLAEYLALMEGDQRLVQCCPGPGEQVDKGCEYAAKCDIHPFLSEVNSQVRDFLKGITLASLTRDAAPGVTAAAAASTEARSIGA